MNPRNLKIFLVLLFRNPENNERIKTKDKSKKIKW